MRLKRFKILHGFGLILFFAQISGAIEAIQAQQPKYYLCVHTKQKIEKHKPCPCGCSKRMKAMAKAKLLNADHPCADEADDSVLPAFARWVFTGDQVGLTAVQYHTSRVQISSPLYISYLSDIETPPPPGALNSHKIP